MHGNDPEHTAHVVRQWIIFKIPHVLDPPLRSPDMNPIDGVLYFCRLLWMDTNEELIIIALSFLFNMSEEVYLSSSYFPNFCACMYKPTGPHQTKLFY